MCLPPAEVSELSSGDFSARSFSSPLCIVSVLGLVAPSSVPPCRLAPAAPGVAELWEPGLELLLLGPWLWLVLLLLVLVGGLGSFSTLCCLDPTGGCLSFSVAVSGRLSSCSARPSDPCVLLSGTASTWVTVSMDSVDVADDLSRRRRSSLDACSSSRMGDSSGSVKTSSEMEPSVLRGAVLPLSLAPGSLRRCSESFC